MKEKFDLDFCFKGSRTYVHGTDIFTMLTETFGKHIKKLDIAFHGITVNNMTFSATKPENKEVKVTFRCLDNDKKRILFGIENRSGIDCRYEYLEENIVKNSIVNIAKENIVLNTKTGYTFIEHVVAMNKALLETLYVDISGKWYFTRLQLQDPIEMSDVASLQLVLKSNFQFKLTKTAIIVNEQEVGFIYFSLIPKES